MPRAGINFVVRRIGHIPHVLSTEDEIFPLANLYGFGRVRLSLRRRRATSTLATHSPVRHGKAVLSGTDPLEATLSQINVFPTRAQLAILLFVVLPIHLLISPVETIRAWRG
jgi:hypothetical protein